MLCMHYTIEMERLHDKEREPFTLTRILTNLIVFRIIDIEKGLPIGQP